MFGWEKLRLPYSDDEHMERIINSLRSNKKVRNMVVTDTHVQYEQYGWINEDN